MALVASAPENDEPNSCNTEAPPNNLIQLNVGGCLFTTSKTTFTDHSQSFFARMLDGDWSETITSGKPIFIDRDPESFGFILRWLRYHGQIDLPEDRTMRQLLCADAEFYQLDILREALDGLGDVSLGNHNRPLPRTVFFCNSDNSHHDQVSFEALKKHCGPKSGFLENLLNELWSTNKGFTEKERFVLDVESQLSFELLMSLFRIGVVPEAIFGGAKRKIAESRAISHSVKLTSTFLKDNELGELAIQVDNLFYPKRK